MEKYEVIKVGEPVELVRYGKYIAASDGKIYKLNWYNRGKMREVKQTKQPSGYLRFRFNEKTMLSHRFIAMCFLQNTNNLPQVNHKDEDKTNNRVDNLEWCTSKYNANYGTHNERVARSLVGKFVNRPDKSKAVSQFTKDGQFVTTYPSIQEAERKTGVHFTTISECCLGKRKTAGGYCWRYKE